MTLLDIARLFLYVREAGPNHGARVNAIQRWSLGQDGDSWCAEWVTMVLDLFYQGESPIPRMQSCQAILDVATQRGWVVPDPQPEDLYLFVNEQGHAHHVGLVTLANPLTGISGNTSADGTSSNGDRVAEHYLLVDPARIRFVRLP